MIVLPRWWLSNCGTIHYSGEMGFLLAPYASNRGEVSPLRRRMHTQQPFIARELRAQLCDDDGRAPGEEMIMAVQL